MFALKRLSFALLGSAILATALAQSSPGDRAWPPEVQKVPTDKAPILSPEEALKTFYLPPGYRLELVASEPLVRDPISMDWDTKGRLWVVEFPAYLRNLDLPEPNLTPMCRVVVLEDTNGDGKMDRRTVFADGLVLPRSVKVTEHGILVAEPPNIWLMRDTDGDLKADTKELISDKFGRRNGSVEGNANSLFWALDNSIYTAESDIYLRFKNGKFEVRRTLARGEWGVTQDDAGRIYRNTNESALHVDFVPTPYYARNPNLLRTRGSYDVLGNFDEVNTVWPVRPNPGTNRAYQEGVDRPDGTLARFTSVCAPLVYRGDRLPSDLYGSVFLAEPAANLVGRVAVADDGKGLRVRKAYQKGEFIASTDERFRPVYNSNAPDGTLYIVDMYRGIIQQRISITHYLHGEITKRKLDEGIELGRIYRVMHTTTRRDESPALAGFTADQLVATLAHPNGWRRDRAQQILVERGDKSVAPALVKLTSNADPRARLHALWTLDGIDAIDVPTVVRALSDASRDVRVSAIRIAERWLVDPESPIQAEVLKLLQDNDWWVREQLVASLGALPPGAREKAIAAALERHADDPVVMDAAISSVRGAESVVLEQILRAVPTQSTRAESAITMLTATVLRSAQEVPAQRVLAGIADDARPAWQRNALLRGAEVAVLGATMPGTVARERPALGARGGPAGEFKFARSPGTETTGRRGTGGGARLLRVSHEPTAFSALASSGKETADRAKRVLARIEWPGKPGATVITPLTPEQQQRFEAGRDVYQNICQTCHQPDGRGQENVASLVGSDLALAPAEVTARILINGKEGTLGLMPPLGAALNDDQVAAVLTYVRREWGQTGSPVEPNTVKTVRAAVGTRPRPWTNDELFSLPEAASIRRTRESNP